MGEGAALAMKMSDITLMDSNLSKLLDSIKMGTRVVLTIQENIMLSLVAKVLVVGLTFAGKVCWQNDFIVCYCCRRWHHANCYLEWHGTIASSRIQKEDRQRRVPGWNECHGRDCI
jgi:hypothetical protein